MFSVQVATSSVDPHVNSSARWDERKKNGMVNVFVICNTRCSRRSLLRLIRCDRILFETISSTRFLTYTVITRSSHPILAILCRHRLSKTSGEQTSSKPKFNPTELSAPSTVHTAFQLQWSIRSMPKAVRSNVSLELWMPWCLCLSCYHPLSRSCWGNWGGQRWLVASRRGSSSELLTSSLTVTVYSLQL